MLISAALEETRDYYIRTHSETTVPTWNSCARLLSAQWPSLEIERLTPRLVRDYIDAELARGLQPGSVNVRLSFLRATCKRAVELDILTDDPTAKIKRCKVDNEIFRNITKDEEARILARIPDAKSQSMIRFAILTGLRRAEQMRLLVDHIDFSVPGGEGMHVPSSKATKKRWVPLGPEPLMIAKAWVTAGGPHVFYPEITKSRLNFGQALYEKTLRRAAMEEGLPRTRWHDLRHACASRMVQAEVSLYVVQRCLGHKSVMTTQRYAHLTDNELREAMGRIR